MTEISNWKKIDIENTHIDDLTLSAPQGNYWQKMMGAIARAFDGEVPELHVMKFIGDEGVGTEFYVDGTNGSDTTGDGSQSKPWATINHACATVCSNYNINSQTVHINVAAGTYGRADLVPQTRTTGSIIIRPVSGASVKISNTGYAISHLGGAWEVDDIALELVVPETASGGAKYIVRSGDGSAGGVTIRHCDLSFIDNAPSGLSPSSQIRCLAAQGGRINVENKADALSADWSGDKGNSSVNWLWASAGGLIDVRAAATGYTYNVSGSFSNFIRVTTQGQYTVGGSGQQATWSYGDTVTGGRYYADGGGTIRTALTNAADVPEYFPGNAAGTVVASEGSWVSPQLPSGFSNTPIHDVTTAEDITTSNASRYVVQLPARTKAAYLYIIMAQGAANKSCNAYFVWNDKNAVITIPTAVSSAASRRVFARGETGDGISTVIGGSIVNTAGTGDALVAPSFPSFPTGDMTSVEFYLSGDGVMPSGTRIRVYADLEG